MRRTLALLPIVALLLASCAEGSNPYHLDPRFSGPVLYVDQMVQRSNAQVLVHPETTPAAPPKAIIFPFRLTQSIEYSRHYGREMAKMFWQAWLGEKVLPTLVYDDSVDARSMSQALSVASAKGADLAILGRVTNLMSGGSVGDSSVAMQIDIYDVHSGALIWSILHGGRMEIGRTVDYILFARKNRMPEDPVWAITDTVSREMGLPVRAWASGNTGGATGY